MKRAAALFLVLCFSGCADEEIAPPPSDAMTAPELSHPREPHATADPPPPIREDQKKTQINLITAAEAAQVPRTAQPAHEPRPAPAVVEPGTVNPLQR